MLNHRNQSLSSKLRPFKILTQDAIGVQAVASASSGHMDRF